MPYWVLTHSPRFWKLDFSCSLLCVLIMVLDILYWKTIAYLCSRWHYEVITSQILSIFSLISPLPHTNSHYLYERNIAWLQRHTNLSNEAFDPIFSLLVPLLYVVFSTFSLRPSIWNSKSSFFHPWAHCALVRTAKPRQADIKISWNTSRSWIHSDCFIMYTCPGYG